MRTVMWLLFLSAAYPLACAWRANRRTSLTHALAWTVAAWLGWGIALALDEGGTRYLALCLVGCAEVAVLGARRPGVAAWNFVVGGLLVVLLLFWAEGVLVGGTVQLGGVRTVFLMGMLAAGMLNYLPTRLAPAALLLGGGSGLEIYGLQTGEASLRDVAAGLVLAAPWAAWVATPVRRSGPAFDGHWLDFRDRYGFVWAQRLREWFNNAAHHAGLPVELGCQGLRPTAGVAPVDEATRAAALSLLLALMKRFGPEGPAQ